MRRGRLLSGQGKSEKEKGIEIEIDEVMGHDWMWLFEEQAKSEFLGISSGFLDRFLDCIIRLGVH